CAIGAPPMDHPNAIRVRELFAAFATGDVDTIRAVIPEHAVWHFPGRRGQLAGTHRGRDAIFAFLLRVRALTGGSFHLELIDVVGNDVHVVALFRGRAERDGRTLDNPTCLRMRIEDGQVAEVWEFVWDLFAVDEFWSGVRILRAAARWGRRAGPELRPGGGDIGQPIRRASSSGSVSQAPLGKAAEREVPLLRIRAHQVQLRAWGTPPK